MKLKFKPKIKMLICAALIFAAALCLLTSCEVFIGRDERGDSSDCKVGVIDVSLPLTEQSKTLYRNGSESEITLAFFKGVSDVPMISISEVVSILRDHVTKNRDSAYELTVSADGERIRLTRDNGAYCEIDFERGSIFFDDYNRFNMLSFELGALDILNSTGFNENGEPEYFKRVTSSEKSGKSSKEFLHTRGIPTAMREGRGYITLQTFSDLFLTPYEVMMNYNSDGVFFLDGNLLGELESGYYKQTDAERSEALIDITYRQLCLLIDFHYGLLEEHGIDGADKYISQIGLKDDFYNDDPAVAFTALKTLVYKYFSDNHSRALMHSPYNQEPNYSLGMAEASVGYWEFYKSYTLYNSYRSEQTAAGLKPYSEIGNTAFVTFSSFTFAETVDYYENSPVNGEYYDEVGLISYAHAMITRENSPIENVVIDLATNTGGQMDGGVYLAAWVLGNAIMHISDPIRDAESTFIYRADVNLDRSFDEKDTISDKNVYLITSPITFSCANYVAAAFKESGRVTILGTTTGGGSCCVYMASMADGSALCFSSTLRMSAYKNGSYYNIDAGIAPDVKITSVEHFFDYNEIIRIINSLN